MRTGVILATYGEPPENGLAAQWAYSYRILRRLTRKVAQIPAPLLPVIATARAINRVKLWDRHGFESPLEPLHERTVADLQAELEGRRVSDVVVAPAYEFRRPDLTDAVRRLRGLGCGHLVVVPMYVAEGDFTHGMTRLGVEDALARTGWPAERLTTCALSECAATEDRLAGAVVGHLLTVLQRRGLEGRLEDWAVLLAAHGTVVTPIPGVDNGLVQFGRLLHRVKSRLRPHAGLVRVGWLNHVRGGRWTSPAVPEALEIIRGHGYRRLVYYPWGFTTDNAETALEGRVALAGMSDPFERVEYVECMNHEAPFIRLLADRVCDHVAALTVAKESTAALSA